MSTSLTNYRPGLLGSRGIDDIFDSFFVDFPTHLKQSTRGYPVVDIYRSKDDKTVMEFALAGFTRDQLKVDVQPDKRTITVSAETTDKTGEDRRIARRSFKRTYVNYDDNLDLGSAEAFFKDGLLSIEVPQRHSAEPVTIEIR